MGNYHFTVQFIFSQLIHKNQNKRKISQRMSVIDYKDFKENFAIKNKLGKGNCASVVQVQHKKTLELFALKYSRYNSVDKLATAFQQLQVVRALDHPVAIKIFYTFVKYTNGFMNQVIEYGIIMELAIRSLEQDFNQRKKMSQFYTQSQLQQLTINLIQFFAHAQKKGYLHRDIKPANILIMPEPQKKSECVLKTNKKYSMNPEPPLHQNAQSQLAKKTTQEKFQKYKVCDFGFGTRLHEFSSKNIAGTACYASPKIRSKFNNTQACIAGNNFQDDVYSLGVTLIELASLKSAEHTSPKSLLIDINIKYGIRFSQFLQSMIEFQEEKRPDFLKLKQNYPNFIGLSHKVINKQKVTEKKNSKNLKANEAIVTPIQKQIYPSKNQIKTVNPQLKIYLPTQKKPKQCRKQFARQKQEECTKINYTFVPNADDQLGYRYLPEQRKQMDDEPIPRIVYYNSISPKKNKFSVDKSLGDKNNKEDKKNKKMVKEQKKEEKKDQKKDHKKEEKKEQKKEQKKRKIQHHLEPSLQKNEIKLRNNDKVKTKRKSQIINQSNYKIECQKYRLMNEQNNNKTKKANEVIQEKQIIDRDSDRSQDGKQSQGTQSIKNTIWIESTAAEEETAKNLLKLCIPNLKSELVSYISVDLKLQFNKNDDKYVDSSENQDIYSERMKLNEVTSTIICVGHENFLNIYYKLPKQRFQSLCLVFDEAQKLVYTQYSIQAQKLAIVTKRNKIKTISLLGIRQLILNSITSNIKSIHADLLKTVGDYHSETNSIQSFAFSEYLDSVFKIKNDGSFWENGHFLGILPKKNINIKFVRKFRDYILLASCQGEVFKYKLNSGSCNEDNYSSQQRNKNDANINLLEYYNCKNTIIGFELLRSSNSKTTKIVAISATGLAYILTENLKIIKIRNMSRNVLVACHVSLQVLPDTEYFNICAVDCFGNLINEQGQVLGQTKVQECLSIFVDYNRDLAFMTTQNGFVYQARIRPPLM